MWTWFVLKPNRIVLYNFERLHVPQKFSVLGSCSRILILGLLNSTKSQKCFLKVPKAPRKIPKLIRAWIHDKIGKLSVQKSKKFSRNSAWIFFERIFFIFLGFKPRQTVLYPENAEMLLFFHFPIVTDCGFLGFSVWSFKGIHGGWSSSQCLSVSDKVGFEWLTTSASMETLNWPLDRSSPCHWDYYLGRLPACHSTLLVYVKSALPFTERNGKTCFDNSHPKTRANLKIFLDWIWSTRSVRFTVKMSSGNSEQKWICWIWIWKWKHSLDFSRTNHKKIQFCFVKNRESLQKLFGFFDHSLDFFLCFNFLIFERNLCFQARTFSKKLQKFSCCLNCRTS